MAVSQLSFAETPEPSARNSSAVASSCLRLSSHAAASRVSRFGMIPAGSDGSRFSTICSSPSDPSRLPPASRDSVNASLTSSIMSPEESLVANWEYSAPSMTPSGVSARPPPGSTAASSWAQPHLPDSARYSSGSGCPALQNCKERVGAKKVQTTAVAKPASPGCWENCRFISRTKRVWRIQLTFRRIKSRRATARWATPSPCPLTSASSSRVILPEAQEET